jgi:protein-S-isoprenylcysteine O-methyltransferase Ste14
MRLHFYNRAREFKGTQTEIEGKVIGMLRRSLLAIGHLLALLYVIGIPWLMELRLDFPVFIKWLGLFILALSVFLLSWVHVSLGNNFSRTLKIKDQHKLVTHGPYRCIRHPMYSAFILIWVGFFLLSSNALIGLAGLAYISVIVIRISKEEKMLRDHFQEEYENYIQQTGRLLPRLGKIE